MGSPKSDGRCGLRVGSFSDPFGHSFPCTTVVRRDDAQASDATARGVIGDSRQVADRRTIIRSPTLAVARMGHRQLRAYPNFWCGTGFQPVFAPARCRCHTILGWALNGELGDAAGPTHATSAGKCARAPSGRGEQKVGHHQGLNAPDNGRTPSGRGRGRVERPGCGGAEDRASLFICAASACAYAETSFPHQDRGTCYREPLEISAFSWVAKLADLRGGGVEEFASVVSSGFWPCYSLFGVQCER